LVGAGRFFSQPRSVWPCAVGIGADAATPITNSIALRAAELPRTALAIGATGVIALPIRVVWVIRRSRTGTPCSAFSTARASELSSATLTPCGQTTEQVPQLEQ